MITLIVAMSEKKLIGTDHGLPWHIPEEFRHFKKATLGHPVVMGRVTWECLPKKPLPGRKNIVISSRMPGAARSVEDALEIARGEGTGQTFIMGGRAVYGASLSHADRILASIVKGEYQGTVYFPDFAFREKRLLESHEQFDVVEYLL